MASNAGQLALGAAAAAVVGVGLVWLVPRPETALVAPAIEETAAPLLSDGGTQETVEDAQTAEAVDLAPTEGATPEATEEVAQLAVPTVGMRAAGDGIMVVTGRAPGAAEIDVLLDGQAIERVTVSSNGDYATVVSIPPSDQGRLLSVIADPEGFAVASVENPLILPTEPQEPVVANTDVIVAGAVSELEEEEIAAVAAPLVEEVPVVNEPATDEGTNTTAAESAVENAATENVQAAAEEAMETVEVVDEAVEDATSPVQPETETAEMSSDEDIAPAASATEDLVAETSNTNESTSVEEATPTSDTVLVADAEGVRVVSNGAGPQVLSNVALDSISYDPTGEVLLTGRATGDGFVQVYVDNQPVTTSRIEAGGDWRTDLPEVDTGVYTLRIDEVDAEGAVVSRIETPFKREEPEAVAAVMAEETAAEDFQVAVRTVQPGATLWAIAREQFGDGVMYVAVYEANKDQIRDPDLIYPGQVFKIPELTE